MDDEMNAFRDGTIGVYERQSSAWEEARDYGLYERVWLDRLTDALPSGASILDLGCGTGRPIAEHFLAAGYEVTGVDASEPMIELARTHLRKGEWHVMDMRALSLRQRFDAIVSWDAFFHLSPEEQRSVLPKVADLIEQNGRLMITVGPSEGSVLGQVAGETVYHGSLDPSEYRRVLKARGFRHVEIEIEDARVKGRTVLFASGKV